MKLMRSLIIGSVFVFVTSVFGQCVKPETRLYLGEPHVPYLFQPYKADYVYRGKIVGLPFKFLRTSANIVELQDRWEETQKIRLDVLDYFPDQKNDRDAFRDIEITSTIDLKTGLLKSLSGTFSNKRDFKMVVSFAEDGKIVATETDGKRTQQKTYENHEKIYPCTFSNTFLSFLPLDDNFSGTFGCVDIDGDSESAKDKIRFTRRTLTVIGSETVTIDAGTFDCFKLADRSEEVKYNSDGTIKSKKQLSNNQFDPNKVWRNVYSSLWVDKKTRKVIKAELNFKIGKLTVEMQKPRRDL